ncbi:hypothetical protein ACSLBF_04485 [Pseudoalteromonas sp. T1lg65]|uniref:hypothetical protein n=1 Tax=Pseudoalteromonas sp. T1lg65 TaxID=2077101 RepID=UPI003F7938B0
MNNKKYKLSALASLSMVLAACGGGGNKAPTTEQKDKPPVTVSAPAPTAAFVHVSETEPMIGDFVELILLSSSRTEKISDIQWTQIAGNPVTFLADKSKLISFRAKSAGNYAFEVSYRKADGSTEKITSEVTVSQQEATITAALGYAMQEGQMPNRSRASLAAYYYQESFTPDKVEWSLVSGGNLEFEPSEDGRSIFFDPPEVEEDTVFDFQVNVTKNETTFTDTVSILVEDAPPISENNVIAYRHRLAKVHSYNPASKYADVLQKCTYSNTLRYDLTCTFAELPLLGQEYEKPTVEQVMDRVLVSHDWMGERFEEFLRQNDQHDDFKYLLRAVTAIVISSDVNPSYYTALSGAIHLSPDYFVTSFDEYLTYLKSPDFRASFGSKLQYSTRWELKNKTAESDAQYLLYHELAHANDYFPKSKWPFYSDSQRLLDAVYPDIQRSNMQSGLLSRAMPLNSTELLALGKVLQTGAEPTEEQQAFLPEDIIHFFENDSASQFYNYASIQEDYASLFHAAMLKAREDSDVVVSIHDKNGDMKWGQAGRIGKADIKPRVSYVVSRVLPEFTELDTFLESLPEPTMLDVNQSTPANSSPLVTSDRTWLNNK